MIEHVNLSSAEKHNVKIYSYTMRIFRISNFFLKAHNCVSFGKNDLYYYRKFEN